MLPVLFSDQRFVVFDKPAGLPVHGGPRGGPCVEDYFPQISRRKDGPWLAHRLDADTSGCLVVALRRAALLAAQAEFAAGRARKIYWAVVAGVPAAHTGTLESHLRKVSSPAGWRMVAGKTGDRAITDWRVLGHDGAQSVLELRPHTGRTHQLRVQCAAAGFAILGDPIYGPQANDTPEPGGKLMLLARSVALDLDPPVTATAPPPPHMAAVLARLGVG